MFKFKILLWAMPKLMQRAINTNAACAKYVAGKRLEFQIQTADGIGRTFRMQDGKEAFLAGLRDEDLQISGDFVQVMWFQGFTDCLQPSPPGTSQGHA